jgi:hypothetical protein
MAYTTYTQPAGYYFQDAEISPATVADGTLVQRFDTKRFPRVGQVLDQGWTSTTALVVTPAGTPAGTSPAATSLTLTATVTAREGKPTGTVQFKDGATNLGAPVAVNASGVAVKTTTLAVGSHPITAVYSGDYLFEPDTSDVVTRVAV